jgi:hypothetical protein
MLERKKYSGKDYAKIGIIACIIVVPLVIAYSAAGYFEEDGIIFWSDWDCDKMTGFAQTESFNRISEEQHRLYNIDMASCIEEP